MSKYDLVIFDVDGTLLDTSDGVLAAVRYTIDEMGYEKIDDDTLSSFIGPPIQNSFASIYGLKGDILQTIATVFRDRYKDYDLLKAAPYDGVFDMLKKLSEHNIISAAATYKREDYATTLLKHFKFDDYMGIMHGGDHENKLKKKDIIEICIDDSGITDKSRIVMVGDTDHDALGAEQVGIDFIAVTFGFGFKNKEDANRVNHVGVADTAYKILDYII